MRRTHPGSRAVTGSMAIPLILAVAEVRGGADVRGDRQPRRLYVRPFEVRSAPWPDRDSARVPQAPLPISRGRFRDRCRHGCAGGLCRARRISRFRLPARSSVDSGRCGRIVLSVSMRLIRIGPGDLPFQGRPVSVLSRCAWPSISPGKTRSPPMSVERRRAVRQCRRRTFADNRDLASPLKAAVAFGVHDITQLRQQVHSHGYHQVRIERMLRRA